MCVGSGEHDGSSAGVGDASKLDHAVTASVTAGAQSSARQRDRMLVQAHRLGQRGRGALHRRRARGVASDDGAPEPAAKRGACGEAGAREVDAGAAQVGADGRRDACDGVRRNVGEEQRGGARGGAMELVAVADGDGESRVDG